MNKIITKVNINLFEGIFDQSFELKDGLNLISGENGTGKTSVLGFISDNLNKAEVIKKNTSDDLNVTSFSPKRSAEKQQAQQAYRVVNQDPNISENTLNQLRQRINDNHYQQIRSIAEILTLACDKQTNLGNITKENAALFVKEEYNKVLKSIFVNYDLILKWDNTEKTYIIKIKKFNREIDLSKLSSGENALVSLLFNIYFVKDNTDIYLIDEPEVHLNWILEEMLFKFLFKFSLENTKQVIVVTHSRVSFKPDYKDSTKYFIWDKEKIVISDTASENLTTLLGGELTQIIESFDSDTPLVYVEDSNHKIILDLIAKKKNQKIIL